MLFSEIPGLTTLKTSLMESFRQNHIAHAQLFYGVAGGGGLPLTLAFATFLLCENKSETDACGVCPSCSKMKKLVHPDVHFYFPKISSGGKDTEADKSRQEALKVWRQGIPENPFLLPESWISMNGYENKNVLISKEDSRHIIQTVSMKSFEGGFKIVLIWCPEFMNASAANALLKVLEEPPVQTLYLMVTHEIEVILPTIKSRTQLFTVPPFSEEEITTFLTNHAIAEDVASQISRVCEGSMGKALAESHLDRSMAYGQFQQWMRECYASDFSKLSERSEEFSKQGKSAQRNELNFALSMIRESILAKAGDDQVMSRTGDEKTFIINFSNRISLEKLEKLYLSISDSLGHLARNANAKITYLHLSIFVSQLISTK